MKKSPYQYSKFNKPLPTTNNYNNNTLSTTTSTNNNGSIPKKQHQIALPEDSSPIDNDGYILYNADYSHYVVHSQKKDYDIYIGRKNPLINSSVSTKWGNPFKVGVDGNRNQCLKLYRDWIFHQDQNDLFQMAKKELKGKILACWCSPLNCHGNVLAEIANSSITNINYIPQKVDSKETTITKDQIISNQPQPQTTSNTTTTIPSTPPPSDTSTTTTPTSTTSKPIFTRNFVDNIWS